MVIIKCAKCRRKIFKYRKVGKGKLWHCWRDRIVEDYSVKKGNKIFCQCGNLIGIDQGKWIKMRQYSFTYSGEIDKK